MERFVAEITSALAHATPAGTRIQIETPPDPSLGDFAFGCFPLVKAYRKPPQAISADLAVTLQSQLGDRFQVTTAGPYVNFSVPEERVRTEVLAPILQSTPGQGSAPQRGTWVFEYSSPNVAKPFLIGHLRSTVLGAALARIAQHRGYHTVSINHLGDWGTQYGKLAVAIEKYGLSSSPTLAELVQIYVRFHDEAEKDPSLQEAARGAFAKLEKGDPKIVAVWKQCSEISLKDFSRIYDRLGVKFDHIWPESFYTDRIEATLGALKKKGVLEEDQGALIVRVTTRDGKEIPPCILQKKDGSTIYGSRDVTAAIYRAEKLKFDRMTYVVGGEQKLHFEQVFGVLRAAGYPWESRCEHVSFGLYRFQDRKMSTRKGNFVTLEDVLTETREAVAGVLAKRDSDADPALRAEICEAVALGAVVYQDLCNDPVRDVQFDVARITDFEGDTGPYLQYAHTRCASLLKKGGAQIPGHLDLLTHPSEIALIKQLGRLGLALERALELRKLHLLCEYLVSVTRAFNHFYQQCPVLHSSTPQELSIARQSLVEATRRVLATGLGLLGIPLPPRM